MRAVRGASKDSTPQEIHKQEEHKRRKHNARLGQPRGVMPRLPQERTSQTETATALRIRRRRERAAEVPPLRKIIFATTTPSVDFNFTLQARAGVV